MKKTIKYFLVSCLVISKFASAMEQVEFKHKLFDLYNDVISSYDLDVINNYKEGFSSEGEKRLAILRKQSKLPTLHPLTPMALNLSSQENGAFSDALNNIYLEDENWVPDWSNRKLKTDLLDELTDSANKIVSLTKPHDVVIYLGRSPAPLFVINHHLKPEGNHIQLNCSGTPAMTGMRQSPEHILRNVVTPERLTYFEDYAHHAGLDKITDPSQTIHIVDIIGTGAGLNGFIQILHHYFISYRKFTHIPQINIVLMNDKDGRSLEYYKLNRGEKTISFRESPYIMPVTLKAETLKLSKSLLEALDDDVIQFYCSSGREYPAFCWQKEFDEHRNTKAQYGENFEQFLISYISYSNDAIKCQYCKIVLEEVLTCSRCKKANYCSKECQKVDWAKHKPICK